MHASVPLIHPRYRFVANFFQKCFTTLSEIVRVEATYSIKLFELCTP